MNRNLAEYEHSIIDIGDSDINKSSANILLLDDDKIILDSLSEFLEMEGHRVFSAENVKQAKTILENNNIEIVISDLNMPDYTGMEFLRFIKANYPQITAIIITAYGSIDSAVEAMKLGAYDYLTKPIIDDELKMTLNRALKQQALQAENIALKEKLKSQQQFGKLIGRDPRMQKIFELIRVVASTSTNILITGESGTGKSLIAREIHQQSPRKDNPFIEVSCGAIPETLLESELFGHTKGSFTGAHTDKQGKFLAANKGTIFLDEIDSASPALQVKLLRVLQERQFEPVGTNKTISVDVRVIVATNKNLKKLVEQEKFRQDLYYRINVVSINLPPLRDRPGDIPLLAEHFLEKYSKIHCNGKNKKRLSEQTLKILMRYNWPGNVRELENAIERAVVLSPSDIIVPQDLPEEILNPIESKNELISSEMPLAQALLKVEKNIILNALERNNWNKQKTAKALGISRTSLFRKMRDFDIHR